MLDSIQSNRLYQLRQQGTLNQAEITELRQLEALSGVQDRDLGANVVSTAAQNIIQSQDQRVTPRIVQENIGTLSEERIVNEPADGTLHGVYAGTENNPVIVENEGTAQGTVIDGTVFDSTPRVNF